jgi:hypothetical protein
MNEVNKILSDKILLLAIYCQHAREPHKARAFRTAATNILNYTKKITERTSKQEFRAIAGIGPSTEKIIKEYLSTGRIERLEELGAQFPERHAVVSQFMEIYGMTPEAADICFDQTLTTLSDIWLRGHLGIGVKMAIMWRLHISNPIAGAEINELYDTLDIIVPQHRMRVVTSALYGSPRLLILFEPVLNMDDILYLLSPYIPISSIDGQNHLSVLHRTEVVATVLIRLSDAHNAYLIHIERRNLD